MRKTYTIDREDLIAMLAAKLPQDEAAVLMQESVRIITPSDYRFGNGDVITIHVEVRSI